MGTASESLTMRTLVVLINTVLALTGTILIYADYREQHRPVPPPPPVVESSTFLPTYIDSITSHHFPPDTCQAQLPLLPCDTPEGGHP